MKRKKSLINTTNDPNLRRFL